MVDWSGPTQRHIILTADEAEKVRGQTIPGHALDPVKLLDGRYILPVVVLGNGAHNKHREFLEHLPQEDVAISEIRTALDPPEPPLPEPDPKPLRGAASPRTPNDPFLGPKLKLERAKRHVADLNRGIREFHQSGPYELVHETDSQTLENVYRLRVHKDVPVELSAIVGDCIHNLRAALDQLICALIVKNSHTISRDSSFPIAIDASELKRSISRKIDGVSPRAERLIYALRPYKSGNPNLWKLHRLDIIDKHQGILPVAAAHAVTLVRHTMPGLFIGPDGTFRIGGGGRPMRTEWGTPIGSRKISPLTDNVEVLRSPPGIPEEIGVALPLVFDQSQIAQDEPIMETLEQLVRFVDKVVGVFERRAI